MRYGDETWEDPILAQMAGLELDDATIGAVVGALGCAPRPVKLDRTRIDRQMRDLALEHAAGRLEDAVYLDRLRALRESKESLEVSTSGAMSADIALAWLRTLSSTWGDADVPEAKAEVLHLRADRGHREDDRVDQADAVGVCTRTGGRVAREGCFGAPDSV